MARRLSYSQRKRRQERRRDIIGAAACVVAGSAVLAIPFILQWGHATGGAAGVAAFMVSIAIGSAAVIAAACAALES